MPQSVSFYRQLLLPRPPCSSTAVSKHHDPPVLGDPVLLHVLAPADDYFPVPVILLTLDTSCTWSSSPLSDRMLLQGQSANRWCSSTARRVRSDRVLPPHVSPVLPNASWLIFVSRFPTMWTPLSTVRVWDLHLLLAKHQEEGHLIQEGP